MPKAWYSSRRPADEAMPPGSRSASAMPRRMDHASSAQESRNADGTNQAQVEMVAALEEQSGGPWHPPIDAQLIQISCPPRAAPIRRP